LAHTAGPANGLSQAGRIAGHFAAKIQHSFIFCTGVHLNIHLSLTPLISLVAGVLILIMPKLLNFIVAVYLIMIGLIGLFGLGSIRIS
jgi:hypothetical protein